jgi:hypothetical protein
MITEYQIAPTKPYDAIIQREPEERERDKDETCG